MKGTAKAADVAAVASKLTAFEQDLKGFLKGEGERTSNAARVLLTLEIASLKRAIDRGDSYAAELAAVARSRPTTRSISRRWSATCREGVPTLRDLAEVFRGVANAMLDAEADRTDANAGRPPDVRRPLGRARAQGRPRRRRCQRRGRVGRMEAALKEGRLGDVLDQAKRLPPKAALAGEDWLKKVEARHAVDKALADVETALKVSLGPRPQRRHGAESDDPHRCFPARRPGAGRRHCTGWPTGRAPHRRMAGLRRRDQRVSRARHPGAGLAALFGVVDSAQGWASPARLGRLLQSAPAEARARCALRAASSPSAPAIARSPSRYASQARKALPNEPLTHLLRAQAAQLTGDRATARRIFEAMLASPDTEQLGLRGLFLEAQREGEREAARQFAERAVKLNPKLAWPVEALFDLQCRAGDWPGALDTLAIARSATT